MSEKAVEIRHYVISVGKNEINSLKMDKYIIQRASRLFEHIIICSIV